MKIFLVPCLVFLSSLSGVVASVVEVALPSGAVSGLKELYRDTRGGSDCCGVSTVAIFKLKAGEDLKGSVQAALEKVGQKESSVDWLLRNPDEEGVYWQLRGSREAVPLKTFLFSSISAFSKLDSKCEEVSKLIAKQIGSSELLSLVHEDIVPFPNVDGNVEVGMTPDEKYLVVVVSDYGA